MRLLSAFVFALLFTTQSLCQIKDSANASGVKECVVLDSIAITNSKLLKKLDCFYRRNLDLIDSNSYLHVFINRYNADDTASFVFNISMGVDLENDMQWVRENKSGYFRLNNTLVLIPVLNDSIGVYKRVDKKLFCFNRRENTTICHGHCSKSEAGFKIQNPNTSKLKLRKLYFFKKPYSKVKKVFYRTFYRKYF